MQKQSSKPRYFPKMPRIAEISNTHCGPAALAMLLANLGVKVSQKRIVESSTTLERIRKHGMAIWEMGVATKKLSNLSFWMKFDANIKDIEFLLSKGYPVGIDWQGKFLQYSDKDDGHYSVVTHISESGSSVFVADTYRHFIGKDRMIDVKYFNKNWWEFNELQNAKIAGMKDKKIKHMMFIVTPKKESFPKEIGMQKLN